MGFVALTISPYGSYFIKESSNKEMTMLGHFFVSDVGFSINSFKDFALDKNSTSTNSNVTYLEKENNIIKLGDLYSEEEDPTELNILNQQFVQLLDDWQKIVCKNKPKAVIIKYEGDQFLIETSDTEF